MPNAFYTIYYQCQGFRECTLTVSPELFGQDLCPDVDKYLEVKYECEPKKKIVCEDDYAMIVCPVGQTIDIVTANWGKTNSPTSCAVDTNQINCNSDALLVLDRECQGARAMCV